MSLLIPFLFLPDNLTDREGATDEVLFLRIRGELSIPGAAAAALDWVRPSPPPSSLAAAEAAAD